MAVQFAKLACATAGLERAARRPARVGAGSAGWVLGATILASAVIFIDGSAVNVALPVLGRDLHASTAQLQWVVEGYTLMLSALLLTGGAAGDRFGRRRIFLTGNLVFGAASIGCGLSPNVTMLIAARFVQGIGGALATPQSLALISTCFEGKARGKAIGMWSGFTAMASAVGPVLGGWLVQTVGWQSVFFLNVPLILAIAVITVLHVPESRDPGSGAERDIVGAALVTVGLGALAYGLIRGQGNLDPYGIGAVVAGVIALGAFVAWEAMTPSPLLPLGIFANRTFSGANAYTFLVYAALGGCLFFVPFDLQYVQGYTPLAAGAALLPFVVIMFALSPWSGGLVARVGAKLPLVVGALVAALGFVLFALCGLDRPYWVSFFAAAFVMGVGGAIFVAPLTTAVMSSVADEHSGIASGINNAISRVAGLIAVAAMGLILLASFYGELDRSLAAAQLQPQTREALASGRNQLSEILVPPSTAQADRTEVRRFLRQSYTASFGRTMFAGALLCIGAAIIAAMTLVGLPPPKTSRRPKRSGSP